MPLIDFLLEKNRLPDPFIRFGIRARLKSHLEMEYGLSPEARLRKKMDFINQLKQSPIAVHSKFANDQHYELPTGFFQLILGSRMKYSSGFYREGVGDLDQAEEDMLALTAERAALKDGQSILELGCGWGSLTLYMAEKFPTAQITAVSNSITQREFILDRAIKCGFKNISVITADMNNFALNQTFDRAVSVEMFEHMRNYQALLKKISAMLKPEGKLFVHIFAHKELCYPYNDNDPNDWIARYFFTGGIMPSHDIFDYFQNDFNVADRWKVSGQHYAKTCRAWLKNQDDHRPDVMTYLRRIYGKENSIKWWVYWRVFFMACEELFFYNGGQEWFVSHTLLEKQL